ncbi:acyl-CoA thioesterase [Thiomicrorhabdus arctica]|uniref:acyl-CoA thioesterase n=1 Tax=Thiomicrorhabdus arctica TaxID=131540 RepID=UPI00036BB285|nr:thioesterase family protein [Thiomicrorhabdus arctica]
MKRQQHWQSSQPFIHGHTVQVDELDFLQHVNNKTYLTWMEQVAWLHSQSVGINHDTQKRLNRIMVIKEHRMFYHAGSYLDDELLIGTWLGEQKGCCVRERHYQIIRVGDGLTVFTATTEFVCVDLKNLRPKPIPEAFIAPYLN